MPPRLVSAVGGATAGDGRHVRGERTGYSFPDRGITGRTAPGGTSARSVAIATSSACTHIPRGTGREKASLCRSDTRSTRNRVPADAPASGSPQSSSCRPRRGGSDPRAGPRRVTQHGVDPLALRSEPQPGTLGSFQQVLALETLGHRGRRGRRHAQLMSEHSGGDSLASEIAVTTTDGSRSYRRCERRQECAEPREESGLVERTPRPASIVSVGR